MGERRQTGQDNQAKISAVVIAAGLSRRMGDFKLLLPWGGATVIGHVVGVLCAAGIDDIVVVTGFRAAEGRGRLKGLRLPDGA